MWLLIGMCVLLCETAGSDKTVPLIEVKEKTVASLPCGTSPPVLNVTWSRDTSGQKQKILSLLHGRDQEIKHINDTGKRYGAAADCSLTITRVSRSDSGIYYCNGIPVQLQVITGECHTGAPPSDTNPPLSDDGVQYPNPALNHNTFRDNLTNREHVQCPNPSLNHNTFRDNLTNREHVQCPNPALNHNTFRDNLTNRAHAQCPNPALNHNTFRDNLTNREHVQCPNPALNHNTFRDNLTNRAHAQCPNPSLNHNTFRDNLTNREHVQCPNPALNHNTFRDNLTNRAHAQCPNPALNHNTFRDNLTNREQIQELKFILTLNTEADLGQETTQSEIPKKPGTEHGGNAEQQVLPVKREKGEATKVKDNKQKQKNKKKMTSTEK
ncbi:hypothetical protein JZ751_009237, partial [Albula glossodonta]